jgi:hypothetical protein
MKPSTKEIQNYVREVFHLPISVRWAKNTIIKLTPHQKLLQEINKGK